jgi:signal transduction histidine kinase
VWIKKSDVKNLSGDIRRIIDGQAIDLRDNKEGEWGMLKNDIHTLAYHKKEQMDVLQAERTAMTDTLVNISHQIKTPLTSMMIMADLLENAPAEKAAEFLSNIKAGLVRMEWLASALLKIAKLDAGVVEFGTDSIQSAELINIALEPLQILLELKNQHIEFAGDELLFCDKRWTSEALSNIIKNASEMSPANSTIRIETGANPICVWISVADSGAGIETRRLFSLFKRFEGSGHDKGYGIGLPLALAIMRGQNGDIEVDGGGNGKGATFTLKFFK